MGHIQSGQPEKLCGKKLTILFYEEEMSSAEKLPPFP